MTQKDFSCRSLRRGGKAASGRPAVATLPRAIAACLVLALGGRAFAGSCDVSNPSSAVCEGMFAHTIGYSIDDLDLRIGGDIPTVVAPRAGSVGVDLYAANGSLGLVNDGRVRTSHASAIVAYAVSGDVGIANNGGVYASHGDGIDAYSLRGSVSVGNDGTIASYGGSLARGIQAASVYGNASVANRGSIEASVGTSYGNAMAYGANVRGYGASLSNDGSIVASGYTGYGAGMAIASNVAGYGSSATTTNNGSLHADFRAAIGGATAIGAGNSALGASGFYNSGLGQVSASASTGYGRSNAYGVFATGSVVAVTNAGSIAADSHADRGIAYARGSFGYAPYGASSTHNTGTIAASADAGSAYGNAFAFGADTVGSSYASTGNSGSIGATASANGDRGFARAVGANTSALYANQDNSGGIAASASVGLGGVGYAFGSYTAGKYGVTDRNTGSISASATTNQGFASARGLYDRSYLRDVATSNTGGIAATARALGDSATGYGGIAYAYGVRSYGKYHTRVDNSGSIAAFSDAPYGIAHATGVSIDSHLGSTLANSGTIGATAHADRYMAQAIGSNVNGRDDARTTNYGSITAAAYADFGSASAYGSGTGTWGIHGVANLDNRGGIAAAASAYAGTARATGAGVLGIVAGGLSNTGGIGAYAAAPQGLASAIGGKAEAIYNDATMANAGSIGAHATGLQAYAYGGVALASQRGTTTNAAGHAVGASAVANGAGGSALAIGGLGLGSIAAVENHGAITAHATADLGDARAYGASLSGDVGAYKNAARYFYASTHNADSHAFNDGAIAAYATAAVGTAHATGLRAASAYGDVAIANAGDILAVASGSSGIAIGLATASSKATIGNDGDITARFDGDGSAQGVVVSASGDVAFTNTGSILAASNGDATGVLFEGAGPVALTNSGAIVAATASGERIAARAGDAGLAIANTGLLDGAIVAGNGGNAFSNGADGRWNASGTTSMFGDGDDRIDNAGTIRLADASIDLGAWKLGNAFANGGRLVVSGDSAIAMGNANPNPFANDGTVDFRNGAGGDVLTLAGDWSGNGRVGVDVGAHVGDVLRIDGSVGVDSVTRVDVNLIDAPKSVLESVPVVQVAGDSTSGSFMLGDVTFDAARSFLTLTAVDLVADIDTSNAHPDVFSVDVAVTGLSDAGSLAAAVAPGVQGLMASEVGTLRQRQGVIAPHAKGEVDAWARAFGDSGTVDPGHLADNFGQGGRFAFDQDNRGTEVGVDVALSDTFSAGLMVGKADASQHLDPSAAGRSRLSGDTRGVHGAWMSPSGIHLDASWRRMDFDARLDAAVGESRASGKASAFDIELGRTWRLGDGLGIEPQLQYTRTSVDSFGTFSGALSGFTPVGGDSSRLRAGVAIDRAFTVAGGATWTPYGSIDAVRELDGRNAYVVDDVFTGSTSTRGTSALAEAGVGMKRGRLSMFASANWQDGGAMNGFFGARFGLGYTW